VSFPDCWEPALEMAPAMAMALVTASAMVM